MKKLGLLVGLGLLVLSGTAEASQFSNGVGKTWGYLFSPVNAVTQLVGDVGTCILTSSVRFVQTVISNANPHNLLP